MTVKGSSGIRCWLGAGGFLWDSYNYKNLFCYNKFHNHVCITVPTLTNGLKTNSPSLI